MRRIRIQELQVSPMYTGHPCLALKLNEAEVASAKGATPDQCSTFGSAGYLPPIPSFHGKEVPVCHWMGHPRRIRVARSRCSYNWTVVAGSLHSAKRWCGNCTSDGYASFHNSEHFYDISLPSGSSSAKRLIDDSYKFVSSE